MAYNPHEHFPLLLFGLVAAPLSAFSLLQVGSIFAVEMAAIVAIFGGCAAVLGIVEHWRHG